MNNARTPSTPSCEAIHARLTLFLLDDLDTQTHAAIARHLEQCDDCRAYADKLAPTLDRLRDVLKEVPDAPPVLSEEHRRRIATARRYRVAPKNEDGRRRPLLLRFHILEMAAVFIGALLIYGLLMPATFTSTDRTRQVSGRIVEPEPMELMMDAAYSYEEVADDERLRSEASRRQEGLEPPAPIGMMVDLAIAAPSRPMSEALSVPVPMNGIDAPPAEHATVKPAEFDSVAMVKSPVIMRGMLGSRSPGSKGEARRREKFPDDDIAIEIGGKEEVSRFGQHLNGQAASGPVVKDGRSGESRQGGDFMSLSGVGEVGAESVALGFAEMGGGSRVRSDDESADPFEPRFQAAGVNPFVSAAVQAFSTFSIDVDTASYTVARNYMFGGRLPPPEAVRTEEFVNFFDYAYDPPVGNTFRVAAEIAPSRFGRGLHLLKLGVKGRRLGREEQRQASLTLLVDSSGSMNQPDRMGLVRAALELLLDELADTDQVAIIQFDNRARLVLAHTPVAQREKIRQVLGAIQCGGGTNLEAGLLQAYAQAAKAFVSRGENRILLMSDGVVNLGETAADSIVKRIEENRRQGLYLSVFGFGMGIYDDAMLKSLAAKGNGAYAFIDSEQEARRVFVDDLSATLNTIAEDVKIQIEFNPQRVNRYRQLGYESRQLTREQFRDDTVDAGEVGSGQSVTALYELDLAAANHPVPYPAQVRMAPDADNWLAIARVRYRRVDNGRIEEIEQRIHARDVQSAFDAASPRFRLAAGVAAFAEILRGSPYVQGVSFDAVAAVLRPVALELHLDARIRELAQMVETAGGLTR